MANNRYSILMEPSPGRQTGTAPLKNDGDQKAAGLPANPQASKETSLFTRKPANPLAGKPTNPQTSKLLKKFTSYLTEDSIKCLKRLAFETERKDYEVLQAALDQYLAENQA